MCTLILGRDVVARGSVLLAANRDEDPARPSDPPGILNDHPRLVGGRDRRAGGTWLAVREGRGVVAILNRRDRPRPMPGIPPDRRSRGMLALEVAAVRVEDWESPSRLGAEPDDIDGRRPLDDAGFPGAALGRALTAIREAPYAPFTLLVATPTACGLLAHEADRDRVVREVPAGWHVITHMDLDDPREPRTAGLLAALAGFAPRTVEQAECRLEELLRSHGEAASGLPAVCLHDGPMVTVSASTVWLAQGQARYRHAEGRPCEHAFVDASHVLTARDTSPGPG